MMLNLRLSEEDLLLAFCLCSSVRESVSLFPFCSCCSVFHQFCFSTLSNSLLYQFRHHCTWSVLSVLRKPVALQSVFVKLLFKHSAFQVICRRPPPPPHHHLILLDGQRVKTEDPFSHWLTLHYHPQHIDSERERSGGWGGGISCNTFYHHLGDHVSLLTKPFVTQNSNYFNEYCFLLPLEIFYGFFMQTECMTSVPQVQLAVTFA